VRSQIRVNAHAALQKPQVPILRVRPSVIEVLIGGDAGALSGLLAGDEADQSGHGWFARDLTSRVRVSVSLDVPQEAQLPCVLGYKPGSDYDLASELIVLLAYYDGLGVDPDGTVYPAANDDASGVGTMLELARLWDEQDLAARRSVLFVAWPAGTLQGNGLATFLRTAANFRFLPALTPNRPAAIVQLEGVGAGGDAVLLHPRSNRRLRDLFAEAAAEVGVPVLSQEWTGADSEELELPQVPSVGVTWANAHVSPEKDTAHRVLPGKLQRVGEVLTLMLTRMVRQARY
jgi:hypothetical protein